MNIHITTIRSDPVNMHVKQQTFSEQIDDNHTIRHMVNIHETSMPSDIQTNMHVTTIHLANIQIAIAYYTFSEQPDNQIYRERRDDHAIRHTVNMRITTIQ